MNTNIAADIGAEQQQQGKSESYANAIEHLHDELKKLDLLIQKRVTSFRNELTAVQQTTLLGSQHPYISHEEVDWLLCDSVIQPTDTAAIDSLLSEINRNIKGRIAASIDNGVFLPLVHVAQVFQLSEFEYHALLICLAPELRTKYDRLYAYLQDDITRKRPSRNLILEILCRNESERWEFRNLLLTDRTLIDACLLTELDDLQSPSGSSDLAKFLSLDPHILDFILGNMSVDHRLDGISMIVRSAISLPDVIMDETIKRSFIAQVSTALQSQNSAPVMIHLNGPDGAGKRTLAAAACSSFNKPLLELNLRNLLQTQHQMHKLLKLAFRDSLLLQAPLFICHIDLLEKPDESTGTVSSRLLQLLQHYNWLSFASSLNPIQDNRLFHRTSFSEYTIPMPDSALRGKAWQRFLESVKLNTATDAINQLAAQFNLTPGRIFDALQSLAHQAHRRGSGIDSNLSLEQLTAVCRKQSNQNLVSLAMKVPPRYGWSDIVLPERISTHLHAICTQVKHQHRVLTEWGFGHKYPYGLGLSALFSGSPGTGKTMAAQVIAGELNLDLYKIDLSNVVSKYIGETERNLKKIFHEAETSNAILLFDECDALFGKRTEVSDAHDRYANIEVSYLLQKLEEYNGIVILTTNLRTNIDDAFLRRIRFIVEFPFPDEKSRNKIWQCHLPEAAPLSQDLDFELLAREYVISGGSIKNIVLNAAFLAAEQQTIIGMPQLVDSARREYEKIGKLWDSRFDVKPALKSATSKGHK